MKISQQYDKLIETLEETKARIVLSKVYHEHQTLIDAAGVTVIAFEHQHKIDEARHLVEHERFVLPQLEQFTAMLARYSAPLEFEPGSVTADELEQQTAERAAVVFEVKKSVKTLSRMRDAIVARRKKLNPEALEIAGRRDSLSGYERSVWTQIFNNTRAERAGNSHLQETLKPLELATV